MATTLTHNHHHHHIGTNNNNPAHFCKDCGIMFESSTSLEVHMSYHKENLLSRWASQDNMDKGTHHLPSPSQSPISSQRPSSANNRQTPPTPTTNGYTFTSQPVEPPSHFVIPQYNNNTGDHNLESTDSPYRHHFGQPPPPPPVDSHLTHLYHTGPPQHSPYHHPMFSPHDQGAHHNNNNNTGPHPPPGTRDSSAEILDLDSHKVHIYQHQQQQLAAERNGNFFHRPYLPHHNGMNGWPPGEPQPHQFMPSGNNGSPHPGSTFPGEQHPPNGYPPVTSNGTGANGVVYDVVRAPGYPNGERYGAPTNGLPPHHSPYGGTSTAGGQYPSGPQPIIKTENLAVSPGVRSPHSQRSPQEILNSGGSNEGMIKSAKVGSTANNSNASSNGSTNGPVKTKGWRGGECKRPKTYNCTACNKWFTSSGHLKRHYGTTLHKNSIRQRGDIPEEPPAKPPTKRGKMSIASQQQQTSSISSNQTSDSLSQDGDSNPASSPRSLTNANNNNNNSLKRKSEDSNGSGGGKSSSPMYGQQTTMNRIMGDTMSNSSNGSSSGPPSSFEGHSHLHRGPPNGGGHPPSVPSGNAPGGPPYGVGGPPAFLPYGSSTGSNAPPGFMNPAGPPPQQQPQYLTGLPPPHPFTTSNNYPLLDVGNTGGVQYSSSAMIAPPMSLPQYSYGNPSIMSNGTTDSAAPLPPFSSVGGFSHFDGSHTFMGHHGPNGGFGNTEQRVSPTYHTQQQSRGDGSSLGPSKETSGNSEGTRNLSENSAGSPTEEDRSGSNCGSLEASLDGLESSEGSPNSCASSTTSSSHNTYSSTEGTEKGRVVSSSASTSEQGNTSGGSGTGEILKCPDCSKTFGRACYLTQHANSLHAGGKPFKCPTCGKRFPEEPALTDHVAKHGSEKPHKCELCPKQFNHKTDLRRHLCLHTGEKPFICNICGKGFIRKDHMTKHTETHRKKNGGRNRNSPNTNNNNNSVNG